MPASLQVSIGEYLLGSLGVAGMAASLGEIPFGPAGSAAAQQVLAEQLFGLENRANACQTLAEQLFGPVGNAGASQTLAEVNSIPSQSPEKFRVWDGDKGQYVYAPRYIWTGTTWAEVGGNTVPSWKHPFLWTGT